MDRNKHILLGVDANLSSPTQHALRIACELLEQSSPDVRLVVLHVIPVPYDPSFSLGVSDGTIRRFSPASQQRMQAERVLLRARTAVQQRGIAPERILWMQREGTPADEIVKAATELGVDRIVIGSRGNALAHKIRRMVVGSTSHCVMRLAPCSLTLVVPPGELHVRDLVNWYQEAVKRSLHECSESLLVFTACDVAQRFAPPGRVVGSTEVEAATHALEQLVSDGLLCCQKVRGELRYLND
jgi:nucleotide-binding universal stress UspA family protein